MRLAGSFAETSLRDAMAAIAPKGVRVGCRTIREGDEAHLLSQEACSIPARHPRVRRDSGAARLIAHELMATLGIDDVTLLRASCGLPAWPAGVVGSLAHDDHVAVAAVAPVSCIASLGIDIEPAQPLADDILALVATSADTMGGVDRRLAGRILFSAKEAVYKTVFPLDRKILNHEDVAVDLNAGRATTTTGRRASLAYCLAPRVVVLAHVS
jgi:4'-phosphopantetheinyl transferase EntD